MEVGRGGRWKGVLIGELELNEVQHRNVTVKITWRVGELAI